MGGGSDRPIFFFELVGDTVWGATAAMLRQLLALALGHDAASSTVGFRSLARWARRHAATT